MASSEAQWPEKLQEYFRREAENRAPILSYRRLVHAKLRETLNRLNSGGPTKAFFKENGVDEYQFALVHAVVLVSLGAWEVARAAKDLTERRSPKSSEHIETMAGEETQRRLLAVLEEAVEVARKMVEEYCGKKDSALSEREFHRPMEIARVAQREAYRRKKKGRG